MSDGAPQLLADLADKLALALAKRGIGPESAAEIGIEIADQMRADWGGQHIYFPQGAAIDITRRDMELWEKFNGHNHAALAREYDLSVIHVYRRVKLVGAAMRAKRQGDLFNTGGAQNGT